MQDTVHNSQPTWAGNDPEPMHSSEERALVLEEQGSNLQSQISTLQNKNDSMRASGNDLLKEKIALKEHNSALANMIANLDSYITKIRSSPPNTTDANAQFITLISHCEQKIPDPPFFSGNRSSLLSTKTLRLLFHL